MTVMHGFELVEPGAPLRRATRERSGLGADQVRIQVAGCGLCHTDLGFALEGVHTRHDLPLILGHEISGIVVEAGADHTHLEGRPVVVPAVLPCGTCADCLAGAPMICRHQVMPGNDVDGGFATEVVVPGLGVCEVPGAPADPDAPLGEVEGLTLRHLAVVADAVSTAWQSVHRAGVQDGQVVAVVGLGGVGGYAAQIAADQGALVIGLDVDPDRLALAEGLGCAVALDPSGLDARSLRGQLRDLARERGAPASRWALLECSGTAAGQDTAWGLLGPGATLMVVGYTRDKLSLRLSNLMAFDARALGNWGCGPDRYPAILRRVLEGGIEVVPHTTLRPLDELPAAFEDVHHGRADRRIVLVPDA